MRINIVGAGITGLTVGCLLKARGHKVSVFEQRHYVGGNCADFWMGLPGHKYTLPVHRCGGHVFHADSKSAWDFLNMYGKFTPFRVFVMARTSHGLVPVPSSCQNETYGCDWTQEEIEERVFRPYTAKQWGMEWKDLPDSIKERVPVKRKDSDARYHLDEYSGVPEHSYQQLFTDMALEGIGESSIHLGCSTGEWKRNPSDLVVYTGRIDEYYEFCLGELYWRSLRWEFKWEDRRPIHILNDCTKNPWTRSIDHSYWRNQDVPVTVVGYEYPCEMSTGTYPMYPLRDKENRNLLGRYQHLAAKDTKTIFCGRLGGYKYLDMDEAILEAFGVADLIGEDKK